jgi:hypothetical protein
VKELLRLELKEMFIKSLIDTNNYSSLLFLHQKKLTLIHRREQLEESPQIAKDREEKIVVKDLLHQLLIKVNQISQEAV